jgi:hypothetical protein
MDITLELIDHATGEIFAQSEVPLESLPERFEGMETTLQVGDADWTVVASDPSTRAEMKKAGRVQLVLRKVVTVDPKTVRFSLPSIVDGVPASVAAPPGVEVSIRLHEDDYRQVEFVHASQAMEVDAELADIARIKSEHRQGGGFDAIHVRKRIPEPLGGVRLRRAELEAALETKSRPWAVKGAGPMVADGYALPDAEAVVYGVAREGFVETLCVYGMLPDVVGRLHAVALAHGLLLVDWCAGQRLRAHEAGFVE